MRLSAFCALLGLALPVVQAQQNVPISTICPNDDICYSINIPEATQSNGDGDIFIQMRAPTSYAWVGLGQGSGMRGANMFIMYANQRNTNVTLSTRRGTGEVMPRFANGPRITMLEGTGVVDNFMVANFRCSNCQTWGQGQSMDFTADSGNWIHASRSGQLRSDEVDAVIQQHTSDYGPFTWSFGDGQGGAFANPFVAVNSNDGNGGGNNNSNTGIQGPSDGNNNASVTNDGDRRTMLLIAHGVLASSAFLVLFPLGAIIIRLLSFSGTVWLHAAMQILAYLAFVSGAGIGIYIGVNGDYMLNGHPIIGLVLLALLLLQPVGGFIHHSNFKKHGGRTAVSYVHIWLGRILIALGMINGGLGLNLANNSPPSGKIAYAVVAAIVGIIWIASSVFGEIRRARSNRDSGSFGGKQPNWR